MNRSWITPVGIIVFLLVTFICCICVIVFGLLWTIQTPVGSSSSSSSSSNSSKPPTPTAVVVQPADPQGTPSEVFTGTLKVLKDTIVPVNDLLDLAKRLEGKENIPATLEPGDIPFQVGTSQKFWVTNVDTTENFQIQATLRYVTDHTYFWIQDGINYNEGDLQRLAETFEQDIYPTDREFFGSEWTPGVDGDPHLYILYASELGQSLAGYFSSTDEYTPQAHQYSNAHEMFLLNADNLDLGEQFTYSVLAHEFQHMIHWYRDRNEETWMNEGFSELAAFLNGYDIGGMDYLYTRDPDLQLTSWPDSTQDSSPYYGGSFLFLTYFLDRFGDNATKALVAEPENGMVSIDKVLTDINAVDPLSGKPLQADDVFSDWVVASYLQDGNVADGRYTYHNYANAPQPPATETVRSCPSGSAARDVSQYGVDYIRINCRGDYTLRFQGASQVGVVPVKPYSGSYSFWSNQGDESDMTLTRTFDFSDHAGPLTLTYQTWYDIEEDYDYVYVEASTDGENWQVLTTPSGTADNPSGNSYGWAYNGKSDGGAADWIQEQVDLSQYAGKKVQIRFEYVTDAAVNGEGFLLDDVSVPQVDYFTDFENGDGGWQPDGFVRIQNVLPQTFRLSLITLGRTTSVQQIELPDSNAVEIPLSIGGDVDEIVLAVSGVTRFTHQKADYSYSLQSR